MRVILIADHVPHRVKERLKETDGYTVILESELDYFEPSYPIDTAVVVGGDAFLLKILDAEPLQNAALQLVSNGNLTRSAGRPVPFSALTKAGLPSVLGKYSLSQTKVDVWEVEVHCRSVGTGEVFVCPLPPMLNYLSVGVDAKIMEQMGQFKITHPVLSKYYSLFYYLFAMNSLVAPAVANDVKVKVDGKLLRVPNNTRSVMICNTAYVGRGNIRSHSINQSSFGDGKLEVLAFSGMGHLTKAKLRMSEGVKIASGSQIFIQCSETPPGFQIDGTPVIPNTGIECLRAASYPDYPGGPCLISVRLARAVSLSLLKR